MTSPFVSSQLLREYQLWNELKEKNIPMSFDLEITARCNNNCRHCFINLPANDRRAKEDELNLEEIESIANQAKELGILWCLITGGEPLLRDDFEEIYIMLKKMGFLVTLFTNACLVNQEHIELFTKYPPRNIEVTVYGVTKETYEHVTRRQGSYHAFRRGLNLLLEGNFTVKLKAMALRSTVENFNEISDFCRKYSTDYRFDPLLNLRFDRNPNRNKEILRERLTADEIVAVEKADSDRLSTFKKNCNEIIIPIEENSRNILFKCGAGTLSFSVSYNGIFRPCICLWHPDFIYDLRKGSLIEALHSVIPRVHGMRSNKPEFLEKCGSCELLNLCLWCPANAYLEGGELDTWYSDFCTIAQARAEVIRNYSNFK